ncbi:flavin oxidoreductase [Acuticoccus sediminis]|uniref:Flavin oxidoreductase n=1 Tax=Acuticoccus sediminis TaxID=2184697 RepID=A0A8B2P0U9_9HYPH|nr:flavin reductase [Acuticoccus sediminis]RAI02420.1 flavin oxidoreductase [Acuticoccus sediminis]
MAPVPHLTPRPAAAAKGPVESGRPGDGLPGFRRSLGEFATGVTVITAAVDGVPYGMTSNSFASVSLDPPLVLWSIRRESTSFAAFSACTHFAVNVLAHDQMDLSQRFARSGPDKFVDLAYTEGGGAAPLFDDVAARFECRRTEAFDGGDHLILMGEVETFCRYDRQPLLFAKGRYAVAVDHPDTRVVTEPAPKADARGIDNQPLAHLTARAYSVMASRLEKGRKTAGLGLSLMQARLLKAAHTYPGATLGDLLPELFLDFNASLDVLESVVDLGLVTVDADGKVHLTGEGEARILSIVEHARFSEEVLLQGIAREDLAATQRVLSRIIEQQF